MGMLFNTKPRHAELIENDPLSYVGTWVSAAGYIRHELRPDGRYSEARGKRRNALQGRYWLDGNIIDYEDDSGFIAQGEFVDGVLRQGGMIFYKVD
jgi:hypothetical protein